MLRAKKSDRSFRRLQAHKVMRAAFPKSIPRPLVPTSRPSEGLDENVPSDYENVEGCEMSNPRDGANVEGKETSNPSDGANLETSETEERVAWLEARVTALEEMVANLQVALGVDDDLESDVDPYAI